MLVLGDIVRDRFATGATTVVTVAESWAGVVSISWSVAEALSVSDGPDVTVPTIVNVAALPGLIVPSCAVIVCPENRDAVPWLAANS